MIDFEISGDVAKLSIKDRLMTIVKKIRPKKNLDEWPSRGKRKSSATGMFKEMTGKSLNERLLGEDKELL